MKSVALLLFILILIVVGCKKNENSMPGNCHDNYIDNTQEHRSDQQSAYDSTTNNYFSENNETAKVRIFSFSHEDAETFDWHFVSRNVQISYANLLEDTKEHLNWVKNILYEENMLIVDIDPEYFRFWSENMGSMGAGTFYYSLLLTFASYPGVVEMKFLVDGQANVEGSHMGFWGTILAENYRSDGNLVIRKMQ